jgi:hypothetical protein
MKSRGASRGNHIFSSNAAEKAIATPASKAMKRIGARTGLGTTMTSPTKTYADPASKQG